MDKTSVELARQGLGMYARELSPAYAQLRDRLMGGMAINNMMLDELRFQEQSVAPNKELISKFTGFLPLADYYDGASHFAVSDSYTARVIENNTIWARGKVITGDNWNPNSRNYEPEYFNAILPFYILGDRPKPDKPRKTELLVMNALSRVRSTKLNHYLEAEIVEVFTDEKAVAEQMVAESIATPYSEEEMKAMFDGKNLRLGVEQAKGFRPTNSRRPTLRMNVPRAVRFSGGIHMSHAHNLKIELTSDILAQFGVFDRLNRLAVAFDKVTELDALLEKYQLAAPKNPLDKLLDT